MIRYSLPFRTAAAVLVLTLVGCSSPKDSKDSNDSISCSVTPSVSSSGFSTFADADPALGDYVTNVVIADYEAFVTAATDLLTAVQALQTSPDSTKVQTARDAWLATREPWERSEAWLFGPVDTEGVDPSVDTWPLDVGTMTTDLADAGYGTTSDDIKGFHAIEYVLWAITGTKNDTAANVATALNGNANYANNLEIVVQDLLDNAELVRDAWVVDGFDDDFLGTGQRNAMVEAIGGMVGIADEVGSGKIGGPFGDGDLSNVESQYSYNSITDFTNNITGIQIAYLGEYSATPTQQTNSIAAFVQANGGATLNTTIKNQIQTALDYIAGMDIAKFHSAPKTTNCAEQAIDALVELRTTLEDELLDFIDGLTFDDEV